MTLVINVCPKNNELGYFCNNSRRKQARELRFSPFHREQKGASEYANFHWSIY